MPAALDSAMLWPGGGPTSKLGFGCSGLSGGLARRRSLALLEAAYAAGIRHFDVAPMYGFGTAEAVLGEFAQRHRGSVTLTTKYGIAPPAGGAALNLARALVRPMANLLPAVRRTLVHRAGQVAQQPRPAFSAAAARASLNRSLKTLRVERVDLFLLHEARASDLQDDALLRMLQDARQQGSIGEFGIGSDAREIELLLRDHASYCPVVQHEWSVLDAAPSDAERSHIVHRTIAGALDTVHARLLRDATTLKAWSADTGQDLANRETLARLLLAASVARAPGVVLFSSRQPGRIRDNCRAVTDPGIRQSALRLLHLLRNNEN